jgi:hypothetical protein
LQDALNAYVRTNSERVQDYWEKKAFADLATECLAAAGLAIRHSRRPCRLSVAQDADRPNGRYLIVPLGSNKPLLSATHLERLPQIHLTEAPLPAQASTRQAKAKDWQSREQERETSGELPDHS